MSTTPKIRDVTQDNSTLAHSLSKVYVIIPAQNEAESLPHVLGDLPPVGRVVVVDNDSSDKTATVARDCGGVVVSETQRGYGAACLAGMRQIEEWVQDGETPPEIIVFLDGDYSDHPDMLPRLIEPIKNGEAEFVLGSRLLGKREPGAMPPQSTYGNRLACFLMWLLWKARYTDLGPFRAIQYEALQRLQMEDRNFGWTVEMQIKAAVIGLRTQEVPVPYRRRIGASKISGTVSGTFKAGTKILYTIAKYGWKSRGSAGKPWQKGEKR